LHCIERLKLIKLQGFEETLDHVSPKQGNTSRDAGYWIMMRKDSISEPLDTASGGRWMPDKD
jgi:hypothetical protein